MACIGLEVKMSKVKVTQLRKRSRDARLLEEHKPLLRPCAAAAAVGM